MMRYNKIRKIDIADGPGVRVSIFLQGCTFKCPGCFNPETHDFAGGKEFTAETLNELLRLCEAGYVKGLSILGGEPLHPQNIAGTIEIAKAFKQKFPEKTIWLWSGFLFENVVDKKIFDYIDVMVDGQFKKDLSSPMLKYCGSSNQRVIDIKKTLAAKKIILWQDEQ